MQLAVTRPLKCNATLQIACPETNGPCKMGGNVADRYYHLYIDKTQLAQPEGGRQAEAYTLTASSVPRAENAQGPDIKRGKPGILMLPPSGVIP